MRIVAATGFAFLLALAPAVAEDAIAPEKIALASELIEVSGATRMFSATDDMIGVMLAQFRKSGIETDAETEAAVKAIVREELEAAKPHLIDEYKKIYARHFSVAEMKDIIAFYKSPTGQHVVTDMPAIMRETMPLSSEMMLRVMNRAAAYLKERAAKASSKDTPAK